MGRKSSSLQRAENYDRKTDTVDIPGLQQPRRSQKDNIKYEGWNFNSGNYLFTTDTK